MASIDSRQALKHSLDPKAGQGIDIDGGGMEEIEQAVIKAFTESESADDAGDAEQIATDGHAGNGGGQPQETSGAGTGTA